MIKRLLFTLALLLTLSVTSRAQISGAGNIGCSGTTVTGTAATSGTSNNTILASTLNVPAYGVLVQLDQTTTITGGAITFLISYDGGANYITVPVSQVLNPSTGAQLTNPYTLVASTNQSFFIVLGGSANLQVKLTTAITGSAIVTPFLTLICSPPTLGPLTLDANGNLLINIKAQGLAKVLVTPDALPANQSVNINQVAGVTPSTNNGTTDSGTRRVTISSDSTGQVKATNFPTTVDVNNGATSASTPRVTISNDSTGQIIPAPTTASGDAVSACNILSTASTNSTNCKGSAGNFYGFEIYNNTTTIYYLRLYNSSSAPTCSSATGFIRTIPIPPAGAAGQAGGAISNQIFPVNYTTGIGYCITGGSSSTDNTSAAAGVFGEIRYK